VGVAEVVAQGTGRGTRYRDPPRGCVPLAGPCSRALEPSIAIVLNSWVPRLLTSGTHIVVVPFEACDVAACVQSPNVEEPSALKRCHASTLPEPEEKDTLTENGMLASRV
jgi:hypothetical protein